MLKAIKISAMPYCVQVDSNKLHSLDEVESWLLKNIGPRLTAEQGYQYRYILHDVGTVGAHVWSFRHQQDAVYFDMVWG